MLVTERLRKAREAKGLTQKDLSHLCNFGVNQINRYERGLLDPTSDSLTLLSKHLDVSVDYLLGLTNNPQGFATPGEVAPDEFEILDTYRREGWAGVMRLGVDKNFK